MSRLIINEKPLMVLPKLAIAIGLNEAMVLQQIHYWIDITRETGNKPINGRYWIRKTTEDWSRQFPFWSEITVKRAIKGLCDRGLVIRDNLNKNKQDRTLSYTIDQSALADLESQIFDDAPSDQIDQIKLNRSI